MPLVPAMLKDQLLDQWLQPAGGHPSSPTESGDRFATAVAGWFALAMAGPFPCTTAAARKGQLAAQAGTALAAGLPPLAGAQLAQAVAAYMTGQSFGAGVAAAPAASAAAVVAMGAVFADLDAEMEVRAERISLACHVLAWSTIVSFPPVVSPPSPVF